jgi:signal transduction histidine kinase
VNNFSKIRSLVSDITGPSLFDRTSFLVLVIPVAVVISVLTRIEGLGLRGVALGATANALAFLACWWLVEICERYFFADRLERPARLLWVLIASAIIGAVKGAVTLGCYIIFELLPFASENFVWHIAQAALLGLLFIPTMAVVAAARSRFQTELGALVAERVQASIQEKTGDLSRETSPGSHGWESSRKCLLVFVAEMRLKLSSTSASRSAALIREQVETRLRPMSHSLWELENRGLPSFTYLTFSRIAAARQTYADGSVAITILIGYMGSVLAIVGLGVEQGLLQAMTLALIFWVGYVVARLIRPVGLVASVACSITIHSLSLLSYFWLIEQLFAPPESGYLLASFLVYSLWFLSSVLLINLISGALATRHGIRERLIQVSAKKTLDSRVEKVGTLLANRDVANYMHGYLQNNLLASALRLERNEKDGKCLVQEITKIEQMLADSLVEAGKVPAMGDSPNLDDQLAAIVKQWAGYVAIEITNEVTGLLGNQARQISQVVGEGVSNALRHGRASQIQVAVGVMTDSKIQIIIIDDGFGPLAGPRGLGSSFFDSIAGSNWSLTAGEMGGSVVRLVMNLQK